MQYLGNTLTDIADVKSGIITSDCPVIALASSEEVVDVISVYPNPAKDQLFVMAENLQMVEVYNVFGQQVMTSMESILNLTELTEGVYFVRVVCEGGMFTKRIVKR